MTEEKVVASVIVCAFNEEKNIGRCIESLLEQDFQNFELIIVDDASCDNTKAVVEKYADSRIKYNRNNKNLGPAGSRNIGLSLTEGRYVFFTDADCIPLSTWISQGIKHLEQEEFIGVEGVTLPQKGFITASDRGVFNLGRRQYMTCNIAYKKDILLKLGGFDGNLRVGEDLDLGLRAEKSGQVSHNNKMIVLHVVNKYRLKPALIYAWNCGKGMVYLIKKHKLNIRVLYPRQFLGLAFPPFLIVYYAFQSLNDFKALPLLYLRLLVLRLSIWIFAFRNRLLLI